MPAKTTYSQYHIVPNSDHNVHFDNPSALTSIIINDLLPTAKVDELNEPNTPSDKNIPDF